MPSATSYGNPEKMVRKRMDDRSVVEIITNICIAVTIMFVVGAILTPFVYYVAKVVPVQQRQMHELRIECLAHHTVQSCMQLTQGTPNE
jgi:hypothetical protein